MAVVQPSDVADIYNQVWMGAGSSQRIAGMLLYAKDEPWSIKRWGGKDDNFVLWTIDFNFSSGGAQKLFTYGKSRYSRSTMPKYEYGTVTVLKVKGDLEQFQRDWVLLKMFEHEWRSE